MSDKPHFKDWPGGPTEDEVRAQYTTIKAGDGYTVIELVLGESPGDADGLFEMPVIAWAVSFDAKTENGWSLPICLNPRPDIYAVRAPGGAVHFPIDGPTYPAGSDALVLVELRRLYDQHTAAPAGRP